ncbi:MAG TPA: hypothetical protein VKQ52_16785 [Puia sp.]|nr:hypothetical protein [Puia sp.]
MRIFVYPLLILSCLYQPVLGQEYRIPFQLTEYNNLSVQAILNRQDTLHLMFHTAENSVTLTEEAAKKSKSLRFDGLVDSVKSWGGQGNSSRFSKNNALQIGGLSWEGLTVWEDQHSGRNTDGKFGPNLFVDRVIEIDFDTKMITLRPDLPDKIGEYEKLKLQVEGHSLYIQATCQIGNDSFTNRFLVHSGYSGAVLLDDQFVSDHHLEERLTVVDGKELKDAYGNVLKTRKAIMPGFRIGNGRLADVPVGFFQGAIGRQKISVIGGDVLRRFNIIIDARREYIYLKPNSLQKVAYWS